MPNVMVIKTENKTAVRTADEYQAMPLRTVSLFPRFFAFFKKEHVISKLSFSTSSLG
jgi:hypothetical protein